jgi:flagellar biosynthesis regulator FlaF
MMKAARAYQASSDVRSQRVQEADVFRRANGALRAALASGDPTDRVRAVADNRRLWLTVTGLLQDPDNRLPAAMRATLVSIGRSVQRVMDDQSPDFEFLISVNENIADGLAAGG